MVYLHKLFVLLNMDLNFLPQTNWVDIIVVIFLIRGGYIGLDQGFSVELFKTLGAIGATVITLLYYNGLGEWLASHSFLSPQIANFLSFLVLVFMLLFVFRVIRLLMFKISHFQLFYGLEKWGGFTLGLARSIVFASLFLFVLTLLPGQYIKESVEEKSFSGPYLKGVAPKVLNFIVMFEPKPEDED